MTTTTFKTDGFLIVARPTKEAPDHVHEFWAFEEVGHAIEGDKEIPLYGSMWQEPESFEGSNLDSMEPVFTGAVKWDGCSNWNFSPDDVMVHLCRPEDMDRLSGAVKACIAEARKLIPNWQDFGGVERTTSPYFTVKTDAQKSVAKWGGRIVPLYADPSDLVKQK